MDKEKRKSNWLHRLTLRVFVVLAIATAGKAMVAFALPAVAEVGAAQEAAKAAVGTVLFDKSTRNGRLQIVKAEVGRRGVETGGEESGAVGEVVTARFFAPNGSVLSISRDTLTKKLTVNLPSGSRLVTRPMGGEELAIEVVGSTGVTWSGVIDKHGSSRHGFLRDLRVAVADAASGNEITLVALAGFLQELEKGSGQGEAPATTISVGALFNLDGCVNDFFTIAAYSAMFLECSWSANPLTCAGIGWFWYQTEMQIIEACNCCF